MEPKGVWLTGFGSTPTHLELKKLLQLEDTHRGLKAKEHLSICDITCTWYVFVLLKQKYYFLIYEIVKLKS